MRILFLTQWFDPEPFFKGLPFAAALRDRGYDVEILTGFPNYPGGKIYPGYRIRFFQREILDGIRVNRAPLYPSHDQSGLGRIINYLSFFFSVLVFGPFAVNRPDIIYVYNLPTLGFAALWLKFFFRAKVVLDVQDLWPESVISSNMMPFKPAQALLKRLCDFVYCKMDRVIAQSQGFKDVLSKRSVKPERIDIIYNWAHEAASFAEMPSAIAFKKEKINFVFAGTMGKMQALDAVIDAATLVGKARTDCEFWFIGGGIEVKRLKSRAASFQNIHFLPRISPNQMDAVYRNADVLIVHLKDEPLFEITIPSKIQSYLHAGKPILIAMNGEAAQLVEAAKAGIACCPENPGSIADALLEFVQMSRVELNAIGANGKRFYDENMSCAIGVKKIINILQN